MNERTLIQAKSAATAVIHLLHEVPEDKYVSVENLDIDTDKGTVQYTWKLVSRQDHPMLYLSNIMGLMATGKGKPKAGELPASILVRRKP